MAKQTISVVIPSYNEMANLQKGTLNKVQNYLKDLGHPHELIVVDDGSNDGSREFVEKLTTNNKNLKLIKNHHTGKAGAVTTGMLAAIGDYVLFTDMDQATPIEEIEKFLPEFNNGADLVIGSRRARKGAPFSRKVMSQGMIMLRKILVGIPDIHDTQCGFKMFKREAARNIFKKIKKIHNGFKQIKGSSVTAGFDVEILLLAEKKGYDIKEVPVSWLYVETRRVSPIKDSIEGVLSLLKIRKAILQGTYK